MMQITPAQVLTELSHHIGEENGIHVRELVVRITGQSASCAMLERHIRIVITDLRMDGAHICGTPTSGYYMAASPAELEKTLQFLRGRAMSTLVLESRMRQISMPELLGQLTLKT